MQSPSDIEPCTVRQAQKLPEWHATVSCKFGALMKNGTWDLVPKPPDQNIVGCKWVFRIKQNPDGSINKYKARLAAKGFHQRS